MTVNTWQLDRNTAKWVGPITYTVTNDAGQPVVDATITFALLPADRRPGATDWIAPVANPDDPAQVGLQVPAVVRVGRYGVWARAVRTSSTVVLGPELVGWIIRT
ncbi:MAG: hypothetical protein ACTHMS_13160 [Jatrophihabitans sp.]|uniref:hypothetical protein n=1 Tax=Jatrophihabitans sp. TaxID=1932789 RepID=UPI003F7D62A5